METFLKKINFTFIVPFCKDKYYTRLEVFDPTYTHKWVQSAGAVKYTDYIFAEGSSPPTSVLDMTLNNLITTLH